MSNNEIILVGGFHEIIELCETCGKRIVGIIDNKIEGEYYGYKILGNDAYAVDLYREYEKVPVLITPDNPNMRKQLAEFYAKIGFVFCNIIHPKADISKFAHIKGVGVVIQRGVNVSANTTIGNFVKINTFTNIMHDSVIDNYVTIAPNAVILGGVKIAESCYIGANATILPGREVGSNSMVGAGAIVTKNITRGATVIGNPAREIDRI